MRIFQCIKDYGGFASVDDILEEVTPLPNEDYPDLHLRGKHGEGYVGKSSFKEVNSEDMKESLYQSWVNGLPEGVTIANRVGDIWLCDEFKYLNENEEWAVHSVYEWDAEGNPLVAAIVPFKIPDDCEVRNVELDGFVLYHALEKNQSGTVIKGVYQPITELPTVDFGVEEDKGLIVGGGQ